jgi:hypothetical protein
MILLPLHEPFAKKENTTKSNKKRVRYDGQTKFNQFNEHSTTGKQIQQIQPIQPFPTNLTL